MRFFIITLSAAKKLKVELRKNVSIVSITVKGFFSILPASNLKRFTTKFQMV